MSSLGQDCHMGKHIKQMKWNHQFGDQMQHLHQEKQPSLLHTSFMPFRSQIHALQNIDEY